MATSAGHGDYQGFLERAYTLKGQDDNKKLYDDWADTYDSHLNPEIYKSPQAAVDAVVREVYSDGTDKIEVLDAGCGTGLVADCFKKSKLSDRCEIDGLDLTQAMLDVAAKKNVYRKLETADLTRRIDRPDGSYDVITCIGTLTKGHVGPDVLREFARVAKKGGIIVCSVHDHIWEPMQYKSTVEELRDQNAVSVLGTGKFDMFSNADEPGRLVVLKKL